jgi:hypothetical protein
MGYSSRDWLHNTFTLPTSAILREIRFPVFSMTLWATCISLIYKYLPNRALAKHMIIPGDPHKLLVSSLGLLLVFRTNSAYQRFVEGRKIWYVPPLFFSFFPAKGDILLNKLFACMCMFLVWLGSRYCPFHVICRE